MISKNRIRFIRSLHHKKNRNIEGLFLAEGGKNLSELVAGNSPYQVEHLYIFKDFYPKVREKLQRNSFPVTEVSLEDLQSISTLEENRHGLAVLSMKEARIQALEKGQIILALDGIRDPGNLGTIIRTADWFGVSQIWASADTAEFFNPKTIMATMGSFLRLQVAYCNLPDELPKVNGIKMGASLEGAPMKPIPQGMPIILIIGSESHGIRAEVANLLDQKFKIPGFGKAESLNAGVATGISLYALRTTS